MQHPDLYLFLLNWKIWPNREESLHSVCSTQSTLSGCHPQNHSASCYSFIGVLVLIIHLTESGIIWERGLWTQLWRFILITFIEAGRPTCCECHFHLKRVYMEKPTTTHSLVFSSDCAHEQLLQAPAAWCP